MLKKQTKTNPRVNKLTHVGRARSHRASGFFRAALWKVSLLSETLQLSETEPNATWLCFGPQFLLSPYFPAVNTTRHALRFTQTLKSAVCPCLKRLHWGLSSCCRSSTSYKHQPCYWNDHNHNTQLYTWVVTWTYWTWIMTDKYQHIVPHASFNDTTQSLKLCHGRMFLTN